MVIISIISILAVFALGCTFLLCILFFMSLAGLKKAEGLMLPVRCVMLVIAMILLLVTFIGSITCLL